MPLEVEQKFRVHDLATIAVRLAAYGAKLSDPELQVDRYFNHPARDFVQTDEALRIRSVGETNFITYKGPKLDRTTKTRREIEIPIATGETAAFALAQLLGALGFRPVADVRKRRREVTLDHTGRAIEVVLDEVEQVGTYVELECVVDEAQMEAAKRAIASLAAELGLVENERKSYLELLLEHR
jgi:adenylate cyclase class 2